MDPEDLAQELSDQDRLLVVFGYLGPLALVSLVASRRELVKWHAKQGLVVSATLAGLYPLFKLMHFALDRSFLWPIFGEIFWVCVSLVLLGAAVMLVVCIIRGLEGERFKIPMLGDLADRL